MDYKALLNHFWTLDMEFGYTGSEAKLFLYLLRHAAEVGPVFGLADRQAGAMVGVSEKVFKAARNRLHETGLVTVEIGGAGGRGSRTHYQLVTPERKKGGQKLPPLLAKNAPERGAENDPLLGMKTAEKGGRNYPPLGQKNDEKGGQKTTPFQERKVSPLHPPSKERTGFDERLDARARGQPAESTVNPQIRPPSQEEIKAFAAIAGLDPELAIAAAEGLTAIGWIDKHNRPYLDWRSPVKQGARTLAKMRANDKAKETRNGAYQHSTTAGTTRTQTQQQRDFARTPLDEDAFRGFEASFGE